LSGIRLAQNLLKMAGVHVGEVVQILRVVTGVQRVDSVLGHAPAERGTKETLVPANPVIEGKHSFTARYGDTLQRGGQCREKPPLENVGFKIHTLDSRRLDPPNAGKGVLLDTVLKGLGVTACNQLSCVSQGIKGWSVDLVLYGS
jgi:hypothetical protein